MVAYRMTTSLKNALSNLIAGTYRWRGLAWRRILYCGIPIFYAYLLHPILWIEVAQHTGVTQAATRGGR